MSVNLKVGQKVRLVKCCARFFPISLLGKVFVVESLDIGVKFNGGISFPIGCYIPVEDDAEDIEIEFTDDCILKQKTSYIRTYHISKDNEYKFHILKNVDYAEIKDFDNLFCFVGNGKDWIFSRVLETIKEFIEEYPNYNIYKMGEYVKEKIEFFEKNFEDFNIIEKDENYFLIKKQK